MSSKLSNISKNCVLQRKTMVKPTFNIFLKCPVITSGINVLYSNYLIHV